jgi:hypothetical protein
VQRQSALLENSKDIVASFTYPAVKPHQPGIAMAALFEETTKTERMLIVLSVYAPVNFLRLQPIVYITK